MNLLLWGEYTQIFERRRKVVFEMMNAIPGVCMVMPESGFLSWIDISKLGTSTFICDYLLQHAHVMVNSGVPYGQGGEGYIRLVHGCYKDDEKTLCSFDSNPTGINAVSEGKGDLPWIMKDSFFAAEKIWHYCRCCFYCVVFTILFSFPCL